MASILDNAELNKSRPIIKECRRFFQERKLFFQEAESRFKSGAFLERGSLSDYKRSFYRHRVNVSEYLERYEFWRLTEKERDEFISRSEMQCIYRKLVHPQVMRTFNNKVDFLRRFHQFVNRRWLYLNESGYSEFEDLVTSVNCICKPIKGSAGAGVFKLYRDDIQDPKELYDSLKEKNVLIEECLESCEEMASFHRESLNTIRVMTVSYGDGFKVLGALMRMGVGDSVIDNTHAGGIFAPIDPVTGVIMLDGMDQKHKKYVFHPDSGKQIKGFQIPNWNKVLDVCKKAVHIVPETYFAGWDICICSDGRIELVEANHAPDVDGGLQVPFGKGIKAEVQIVGQEVLGVDPLQFISIWSRSYGWI